MGSLGTSRQAGTATWQPSWGAVPEGDGTRFRAWAPGARALELLLERPGAAPRRVAMEAREAGFFEVFVPDAGAGDRYRFTVDGRGPFPDPASRLQPEGVHGPSVVVDPARFAWSDAGWRGLPLTDVVLYELHVGSFTEEGTFAGVERRLSELRDLGVTAVELMPLADFPGRRNWGYDSAALFAPARCYGTPDDLRRLVDAAHRLGLAIHLDVVYNHFGPDGAYAPALSSRFFSQRHRSPWGAGINLDEEGSAQARGFFIENALHWIHEYHVDGLRLDATHAMVDESPRHFLAELSARVKASAPGREVLLIAEDARNLAYMVKPEADRGWGMDAVWSDDFHHQVRVRLAGDRDGYFQDFSGTAADIVATLRQGWFFTGQHSPYLDTPRGTDPTGVPPERFVICIQNHDQVGNRALGERLHHQIDLAAYRAATVLLLVAPETPLIFMGQEWAASAPFRFFTDHQPELGRLVTEGRRDEFRRFPAFSDPERRKLIPDPQAAETFAASRLDWSEREREPHASILRLHRALLALRRREPALRDPRGGFEVRALDGDTLLLRRLAAGGPALLAVVRLSGSGPVDLGADAGRATWQPVLGSEDPEFCADPAPPRLELAPGTARIVFSRPGAVILRSG